MIKNFLTFTLILLGLVSCNNTISTKEKEKYSSKGKEIAEATFKELSSQLSAQMKEGGTVKAIPFCNVQAYPIVSALESEKNVIIKRTSDKIRNTNNNPTSRELEIILDYKNKLQNKTQLKPVVEKDSINQIHFYAPILMQDKCLACHGKLNENLTVKTDSIIKSLYPNDLATGYAEGELRGIWSIAFKNK